MVGFTGCVNGSPLAHPVTTPLRVVRRWVKSANQIHLVKSVLGFAGNGYLDVVLLDLGKLGERLRDMARTLIAASRRL